MKFRLYECNPGIYEFQEWVHDPTHCVNYGKEASHRWIRLSYITTAENEEEAIKDFHRKVSQVVEGRRFKPRIVEEIEV